LEAGALSADLRRVEAAREWSFVVRQPSLIYLSPVVGQPEIWRQSFEPGSGQSVQLTHTQGGVMDFAPSPDGERIAYTRSNEQGGSDLWVIDRSGSDPRPVVDCGPDLCWGPAWSRTEPRLAFARETAGLAPGTPSSAPRIWILELQTGSATPLYPPDSNVIGFDPSWSPDGTRLAFYDGNAPGIRVLDWNSREEIVLPSNNGVGASWSPDGQVLFFTGLSQFGPSVSVTVYRFSFLDKAATAFLAPDDGGRDYGLPAVSPTGDQVLLAALTPSSVGKQLVVVDAAGSSRRTLAPEPGSIHGGYQWDPWGTWVVFQRFPLLTPEPTPAVYVVPSGGGEPRLIAEGAYRPAWLP
jgi:Tol biopolymer transport system component